MPFTKLYIQNYAIASKSSKFFLFFSLFSFLLVYLVHANPEARIGIFLHNSSFTIFLPKEFKIIENNKIIYYGKKSKIEVKILNFPTNQFEQRFTLCSSSYRSYEQAFFISTKLKKLGFNPKIFYPENWHVCVGNYTNLSELNLSLIKIKENEIENVTICPLHEENTQLEIHVDNFKYFTKNPLLLLHNGPIQINNQFFSQKLEINLDSYGTFSLISIIDVEEYIKSVLPSEMPLSAPIEALKAQSILARTYYFKNKTKHNVDNFELCSTTDCQAYYGKNIPKKAEMAVNETKGIILTFKNEIADALYHSTCGGITAGYTDIWDGEKVDYLIPILDEKNKKVVDFSNPNEFSAFLNTYHSSFCKRSKYWRWEKNLTKDELIETLKETIPKFKGNVNINFDELSDIIIVSRCKSGRVEKIQFLFKNQKLEFKKDEIRWILGKLKSTLFTIEKDSNLNIKIKGGGWGHGVGLCQIGAIKMAEIGKNFKEIIYHYYPGTQLKRIY